MVHPVRIRTLDMEMRETTRGKPKLCFDGYAYVVDKKVDCRVYWKCEQYGECRGRVVTVRDAFNGEHEVVSLKPHESHRSDSTRVDVLEAVTSIKEKALRTTSAPVQILQVRFVYCR
ncbi:hypothetical protein ISCGN_029707 [Ixodes scapularis]